MEELKGHPGALEALMRKIPGFSGYLDRERRRDADKLQREFLARGTTTLKGKMQDLQETLINNGDMGSMTKLDDVGNRIDRVTARLRHANYGYAGFFDQNQVNEDELSRIYDFDLSLINALQAAEDALKALDNAVAANDNVGANLTAFDRTIRDMDAKLDERERLLKGVS